MPDQSATPPPTSGAVPLDAQRHLDRAGRQEGILCAGCNQLIHAGFEYLSLKVEMVGTDAAVARARAFICDRDSCEDKRVQASKTASAWRPCRAWHVNEDAEDGEPVEPEPEEESPNGST